MPPRGPAPTVFDRRPPPPGIVEAALAGSRHEVFWLDGLSRPSHPELIGSHAANLVIIGGGYTGLWTGNGHPVGGDRAAPDRVAGRRPGFLDEAATRALVHSPTSLAGVWDRQDTALSIPAGWHSSSLG